MAWRPTRFLMEGELDNTTLGKVTGWMKFAGKENKIYFDLKGNFHRDIQGAKICFCGDAREDDTTAKEYMKGLSEQQVGKAGDMTAGLPPADYSDHCYLEWYSEDNGRVVVELETEKVRVIGTPIPLSKALPISREEQVHNMSEFLNELSTMWCSKKKPKN